METGQKNGNRADVRQMVGTPPVLAGVTALETLVLVIKERFEGMRCLMSMVCPHLVWKWPLPASRLQAEERRGGKD